ncbi:hypothetical protein HMPREF9148_02683, partial [Prevotella sp. F0091]
AKIHILKQFTTPYANTTIGVSVVRANAKIHILKQFTTLQLYLLLLIMLYMLMQRYTF